MKYNYFIRVLPLITTILIIIVLTFSNYKVNTRLRILIWNLPSLSLGSYIGISTGAGFMISYLLTSKLTSVNTFKSKQSIKFGSFQENVDDDDYITSNFSDDKEKVLIERNINDPLPTVNAQFRVIGKTQKVDPYYQKNIKTSEYENLNNYDGESDKEHDEDIKQRKDFSNDWNDDSFASW